MVGVVAVDAGGGGLHGVGGAGGADDEHGESGGHHLFCLGVSTSQELCEHLDLQANKAKTIIITYQQFRIYVKLCAEQIKPQSDHVLNK